MPIRFQRDAIDDKRRYCVKREKNKEERLKIPIISKSSRLEKKKILLHACQENNDKKHDKSYCTLSTDFVHVVLKSLS